MTLHDEQAIRSDIPATPSWGSPWDCPKCGHPNANRALCEMCMTRRQWRAPATTVEPPSADSVAVAPQARVRLFRWYVKPGTVFTIIGVLIGVTILLTRSTDHTIGADELAKALQPQSGRAFVSSESHFRVTFPGAPTRTTKDVGEEPFSVAMTSYLSVKGGHAFGVSVVDAPPELSIDLNTAVRDTAKTTKGQVVSATITTFQGFPAADAFMSAPGGLTNHMLLVRAPNRVYELDVISTERDPSGFASFRDSFTIEP